MSHSATNIRKLNRGFDNKVLITNSYNTNEKILHSMTYFVLCRDIFAQTQNANDVDDEKASFYSQRYCVLHSADSNFLLKLDTRTGQIFPINMKFFAKVSIEKKCTYEPLVLENEYNEGRFAIYRTSDSNTFLLLDQITGNSWRYRYTYSNGELVISPTKKE